MVLMIARQEACPCEQRPNSRATVSEEAQIRVGKQLRAENRQTDSLNKSQLTLSCGVMMKGEIVSMDMMMMSETQSS
jgi:hypothetical protein